MILFQIKTRYDTLAMGMAHLSRFLMLPLFNNNGPGLFAVAAFLFLSILKLSYYAVDFSVS